MSLWAQAPRPTYGKAVALETLEVGRWFVHEDVTFCRCVFKVVGRDKGAGPKRVFVNIVKQCARCDILAEYRGSFGPWLRVIPWDRLAQELEETFGEQDVNES